MSDKFTQIDHALLQEHVRVHRGQDLANHCLLGRPEVPAENGGAWQNQCRSAVLELMRIGVLVRDAADRIIEHNAAAERLLGLSFGQMRGLAALDAGWRLLQPNGSDLPADQTPSRLTLRDGKPRHGVLIGVVVPAVEVRWFSFNSDPLHDLNGQLFAAVCSFFEVTGIASQILEIGHVPGAPPSSVVSAPRPTLASIARRLGISTASVSMALRNNPRISSEMREKVKGVADELGYRSDPHVQRAMARIRIGRPAAAKGNLCALGGPAPLADPFVAALIAAARLRAEQLGYGFSVEQHDRLHPEPTGLTRMLVHRGVDGLLLLPQRAPWACDELLAWSRFAVMTVGHCVRSPDFDRVAVDWFSTIHSTCAELAGRGYRRVGAVLESRLDELCGHRIAAALGSVHLHLPFDPVPVFPYRNMDSRMLASQLPGSSPATLIADLTGRTVCPLVWQDFCHRLKAWYRREQPDALLIDNESTALVVLEALGLSPSGDLGVAVLNRRSDSQFAGWEERPVEVGSMAIDLLDHKVRQTEHGVRSAPSTKTIKGFWRDGPSVRSRPDAGLNEAALFPVSVAAPGASRKPFPGIRDVARV